MISLKSPAKINLFLRVLGKRSDGYHDLASLFQTIDLHDILTFTLSEEDLFESNDSHLKMDEHNLIFKAIALFKQKTGKKFQLKVNLLKNIPMMAGLGGGSSNAATTLYALNTLLKTAISCDELAAWGSEIGSDISFFFAEGTAYCTGRGEKVQKLKALTAQDPLYLIKPPFGISTADVFKNLNITSQGLFSPDEALQGFYDHLPVYYNDLEAPAIKIAPSLLSYKEDLLRLGFKQVFMTGSGSAFCCFGNPQAQPTLPHKLFQQVAYVRRESCGWY